MQIQRMELFAAGGLVGGEWIQADDGKTLAVDNPATSEIIGEIPLMGKAETHRAISAAQAAMESWRNQTAKFRAAALMRWHQLILENGEDLARMMTLEQGKPLAESRGEVGYGASFVEWFAEESKRAYGEVIPSFKPNSQVRITREAVGVAALITPWNFPIAMITRKAAPALAAGCAIVVKPAELTPFCGIALARLAMEAGIPPGVFNLVTGDAAAIGEEMCGNPMVRALSFTGSTRVGKLLASQCAGTLKRLALELGGNAPFIVFDDADIPRAAEQALACKFRNAGQTCVCANRIFVHNEVFDDFLAEFKKRVGGLKVGDGFEDGVTQGPLINASAMAKVERHIADAVDKGAAVAVGGSRHARGGNFFEPTILSDVPDSALPSREETFGPVAPLYRFHNEDEAIRRANATPHGLAAFFCTRDLGRMMRVSAALEAGIVGVNEGIISTEVAPFGGVKESGIGREGSHLGLDEFLEIKYTLIGY